MRAGDVMSGGRVTRRLWMQRRAARSAAAAGLLCAFAFVAIANPPSVAAFETETTTTPVGLPCTACHGGGSGTTSTTVSPGGKGPHGGYTTGTSKCGSCHYTHDAPVDVMLLPAQTIKATCEMCHDGTGGTGVYGVIKARTGRNPGSAHRIDKTNNVPAGSVTGRATMTFSGEDSFLTCSDCHSPHDNNTVAPFSGDRLRSADGTVAREPSSRLLRKQPGGTAVAIPAYGSSWCAACHRGALEGVTRPGRMANHSVETETVGVTYQNVARVAGANTTATVLGPLGGSNFGYVMPFPRTPEQSGKGAICQQCHEDARHVGDDPGARYQVTSTEVFHVSVPDGMEASDTPRFQTFPHEGQIGGFLIETADDLCLNCHPA